MPKKGSNIEDRKKARSASISNRELLIAASESNLEEIDRLIKKEGVDVNFKDRDGNTSLHWAIESGDLKVVKLLVNEGAIVNIKNNKNETPIDLVKRINRQDIIQFLERSLDPKLQVQLLQPKDKGVDMGTQNRQEKRLNPVHGNIYQLKVLMLFLYRGVSRQYSFHLGTEIKEAKKFDDLVFEYIQDDKKVYRLLQAKHRLDESKKITADNLLRGNNGDYSLTKYFFSYQDSKKEELFKDGSIKDVTICTNINFDFEHLKDAHIGVERIKDEDDILDVESDKKQPARYKFSKDVASLLKPRLQNYSLARLARTDEYSDDRVQEFLNHLIFAVNQPNEEELGKIVKKEIGKEFDFITTENVYNKFFITMLDWLQGKERGMFLSHEEGKEFFEEARRGIPIWFGVRSPVESFIGRIEQLDNLHRIFQDEGQTAMPQTISISGLGGVGKSELVRKYINEYSQKYDNKVVWINAESYQTLVESFRRLACDKLKISTKNANGEEKEISSIVEDVYKFFSNGKSLFIFDNAEKYKSRNEFDHGIDKFLPSLPLNCNKPYVLITSRNQKWPKNIKILSLGAFNEKEAMKFIKESLNIKNNAQKKGVKWLARELQFFPLALQQAVAYIRVQDEKLKNVGSEFKINDYLKRYREKTEELLDFEFPEDSDNDYNKTVFATWNITLDTIKHKENANDALEILNIMSYLAPENISTEMVLNLASDKEKLGSAIELLRQYSMVDLEYTVLNVHRLVQQVTRVQLKKQNREKEILKQALKLFSKDNVSLHIGHAISVWNYSSKYSELIKKFSHLSSYISVALIDSARYKEAYSFGLKVSELLSTIPLDNPSILVGLLATKNNIAGALLKQGKYDIALKDFQEVFNVQKIIVGPDHSETLATKGNIALSLFKQGKYNEALKCYQEILGVNKIMLGENHSDTLSTKHNIAGILLNQGKYDEALQTFQEIHNIQEATLGENHSQTLNTKNSIAGALVKQSKYDEALQMFQKICNIQGATLKKNHPKVLLTKNNIAGIFLSQGKYSNALQIYQEVLNTEKAVLGGNHPDVLCTLRHVAEVLRMQSKYDEALEICQEVFDKQKCTLGSDHPDVLNTQYSKALILDNQSKHNDALQIYQEVLSKRKVILGNDHPDTLKVSNCIAIIFSKQGEYDRALQYYREVLKTQKSSLGENHPDTLATKNNMGMVLYSKKEYDQALQIFQEVFNKLQRLLPDHPDTLSAKNNIALVLFSQKRHSEALKTFRDVLDSQEAILGKEHYNTITIKNNIAAILLEQGRHNEALRVLWEVFKGHNKVLGPEHPETLGISKTIQSLSMAASDLLTVVKDNNFEKIGNLVRNGGDVNTRDNDDRTLLHHAVNNGNIDIVNILLENGANPTMVTSKGNTPLHIASLKGYKEIVETLLKYVKQTSCDKLSSFINARTTTKGTTALHVATKNGYLEIVRLLFDHMADLNVKDKDRKTPLDLAEEKLIQDPKSNDLKEIVNILNQQSQQIKPPSNASKPESQLPDKTNNKPKTHLSSVTTSDKLTKTRLPDHK